MTEHEWLASADPAVMMAWLTSHGGIGAERRRPTGVYVAVCLDCGRKVRALGRNRLPPWAKTLLDSILGKE